MEGEVPRSVERQELEESNSSIFLLFFHKGHQCIGSYPLTFTAESTLLKPLIEIIAYPGTPL
jgi:hypothetical protein